MKKKVLAIMLSLVMVFTLAACGNGGNGGDTGESSAPEWKSYDEKIKAIRNRSGKARSADARSRGSAYVDLGRYSAVLLQ